MDYGYPDPFDPAAPNPAAMRQAVLRGQPPQAPVDPVMQQYQQLLAQQAQLAKQQEQAYAPPDYAKLEAHGREREKQGGQHLLMALAANEAGKDFAPMQAQFLKQAAEYQAPQKMTGGQLTNQGFVEDPGYRQDLKLKQYEAKIRATDQALQGNLSLQERSRLEKDRQAAAKELADQASADRRFLGGQASADRRHSADLAHQDRVAAAQTAAGGPLAKMTAGDDKEITQALQGLASVDSAVLAVKAAPGAFGRVKGAVDYLPGVVGQAAMSERDKALSSPERIARTKVYNDVSAIITQRAGTAQSASEQKRLNSFLPGPTDDAEVILDKLAAYRAYIQEQGTAVEGKYPGRPSRLGGEPTVVRTGTRNGKRVEQMSDGSIRDAQ
jgi:hypothetical protein